MSVVQHNGATSAGGLSLSVTLPSAPTAGNTLVAFLTTHGSSAPTGPSGWTQRYNSTGGTAPGGSTNRIACWFLANIPGGTSATVSVSTAANQRKALVVVELNAFALDDQNAGSTTHGTSASSPGITTTAIDHVLAVVHGCPTATVTPTWDDGFSSLRDTQSTSSTDGAGTYVSEQDFASGVGTGTVTATLGLTLDWRVAQIGFKANAVPATDLFPTSIVTDEAFGTPTLTPGPVTVSPTGIPSAEAFGTPIVNGASQIEEAYAAALTKGEGDAQLNEAYGAALSQVDAAAQLKQVYAVVWWKETARPWRGWGIPF